VYSKLYIRREINTSKDKHLNRTIETFRKHGSASRGGGKGKGEGVDRE
jgi:hypothetical protein